MTLTIASDDHAAVTNEAVAALIFEIAIVVAKREGCSGPNAIALIVAGIARIMLDNDQSKQQSAQLFRAFAELIETPRYDVAAEKKCNDAIMAFVLAAAASEEMS